MAGHSYKLHCQTTNVQGTRDRLALQFHICRDGQADEIWIFHTVSREHVSKGPRIFI
jgi:hypothetical protein